MAQTFWTGSSLSFTNGSKIVTVNTGPSVDSIYPNSKLKSGNYNEPVEVKAAYGSTIELYENWPGSTANTSATITPSSAAAAAAGVAAQQVVTEIQSLVGSASATATANSFVKRDSNGRIKSATPSANDDVVTKGFIGSAATKNVGTDAGNVMEVGSFGLGSLDCPTISDLTQEVKSGLYKFRADSTGAPPETAAATFWYSVVVTQSLQERVTFLAQVVTGGDPRLFLGERIGKTGVIRWVEAYHSGNTNFNEFGGSQLDSYFYGHNISGSSSLFYQFINSTTPPTSITVAPEGTWSLISYNGTVLRSGITAADINFSGNSSGRMLRFSVQGSSGLINTEQVELRADNNLSKITVNF